MKFREMETGIGKIVVSNARFETGVSEYELLVGLEGRREVDSGAR